MKILVAVDEESAGLVTDFLAKQPWSEDTAFRVVTVHDTKSKQSRHARQTTTPTTSERALSSQLGLMVELAECRLGDAFPKAAIDSCVLLGPVATSISREALKWGADLIAVGSHHRRGLYKLLYGSVSESVLHDAGCSMLVVPIKSKCEDVQPVQPSKGPAMHSVLL